MTWQGWEALLSATEQDCAAQEQLLYERQLAAAPYAYMHEELDVDSEAGSQADQPSSYQSAISKGKRKREAGAGRNNLPGGPCTHCGCKVSPQWRRPTGQVLCNACGIFWNRHHRLPPHKKAPAPAQTVPSDSSDSMAAVKDTVALPTNTAAPTTTVKGEILLQALPAVRTHTIRKSATPPQMVPQPTAAAMVASNRTPTNDELTHQGGSGIVEPVDAGVAGDAGRHAPRRRLSPPSSPSDSNLSSHHHMPAISPTLPALSNDTAGHVPAVTSSPVVTSGTHGEPTYHMLPATPVVRRPATTAAAMSFQGMSIFSGMHVRTATVAAAPKPAAAVQGVHSAPAAAGSNVAAVARQPILLRTFTCSGPKRHWAVRT